MVRPVTVSGSAVRTDRTVEGCGVGFGTVKRDVSEAKSNWNKCLMINNVMTVGKSMLVIINTIG